MGVAVNRIIQRTDTQDAYPNTELVVFQGDSRMFFEALWRGGVDGGPVDGLAVLVCDRTGSL